MQRKREGRKREGGREGGREGERERGGGRKGGCVNSTRLIYVTTISTIHTILYAV